MKRKLLCLFMAVLLMFSAFVLTSCGDTPETGTVTRMTVDINPSVEFMVDDENKVISVTALNDDGSIIIAGEAFIGKTPEEAVELMVNIAADTGYLVKGNVKADENTVKISVSGDTGYAKELLLGVEEKVNATLSALNISGVVEKVNSLGIEALRTMANKCTLYTEEELADMSESQICSAIAESRIDTALLVTEDMRNAYYSAKDYEISLAKSEATAKVIESLGGLYTITHTAYKTALDTYSSAINALDDMRYELLISPESDYQKSLVALREAKVEFLKERSYTATLDINGEEYASATVSLQASEEAYNRALAAYEELGNTVNAAMESLIARLRQAEDALTELEKTLFDENIEAKLLEKAGELDATLNAKKDSFFTEFETAHKDDIEAIEAAIIAKKAELKATVSENE